MKVTDLNDLSVLITDWDDLIKQVKASKRLAEIWFSANLGTWLTCKEQAWHVAKHWDMSDPATPAFIRKAMA